MTAFAKEEAAVAAGRSELMAETLIIVNPRSANGRAGRNWQQIEAPLRARLPFPFDVAFTERPGPRDGDRARAATAAASASSCSAATAR